jgi:D-beta-D-heptose 7-phosphate kinase/D-beta-D-heptose 1-phosphate adenosyltransferase
VISAFTVALAAGAMPGEAAWLANVAGGVVVMKRGTGTVTPGELAESLSHDGGARRR